MISKAAHFFWKKSRNSQENVNDKVWSFWNVFEIALYHRCFPKFLEYFKKINLSKQFKKYTRKILSRYLGFIASLLVSLYI